jgi:hypothetical protein
MANRRNIVQADKSGTKYEKFNNKKRKQPGEAAASRSGIAIGSVVLSSKVLPSGPGATRV